MNTLVKASHDDEGKLRVRILPKPRTKRHVQVLLILNELARLENEVLFPEQIAERTRVPLPLVKRCMNELYDDPDNYAGKLANLLRQA